jgi:hypothetical protein
MNRDFFGECGTAAIADLEDIASTLNFVSAAFKVYAKSGDVLRLVANDPEARKTLTDFRSSNVGDLTVLHRALYVQVWTTFEAFVKKLIVA